MSISSYGYFTTGEKNYDPPFDAKKARERERQNILALFDAPVKPRSKNSQPNRKTRLESK